LTLFELTRYDQVTHYAVASGAWSNPAIWHDGIVPTNGAHVLIPIGVEVSVDGIFTARLATVRVDGRLMFATTANSDYVARTGTLTFAPGETRKTITIEVKGDAKREADKYFYLDLFGNSSNSLFARSRGLGTILNDD
jgi:hypothetical protein